MKDTITYDPDIVGIAIGYLGVLTLTFLQYIS